MAEVQFTDVDIKNLLAIVNSAQIKGGEAETIVLLKQKLAKMIEPDEPEKQKKKN